MVCKLYKQYVHRLTRVVCGLPISWRPDFATTKHINGVETVAWSSCSRFIAVGPSGSIEVLDAVTLERLRTFTHPFSEAKWLGFSPDSRSLTLINGGEDGSTTWDLQTGGRIGAISPTPEMGSLWHPSPTYSMDGKMIAVSGSGGWYSDHFGETLISIYDLVWGVRVYSHRVSRACTVARTWTRGEFLRFATANRESITIWEVGFTPKRTLAEIESMPAPDCTYSKECLFLPTPSRLAFILREAVLIWDVQDSKILLNFVGGDKLGGLSFSSDGRFFACGGRGKAHLWKESPTGYVLHRKLISSLATDWITPFLSPDGESIIMSKLHETQLWRTTDPTNPPSSVPPQPAEQTRFVLAFSPGESFVATGRLGENIATIVDLKSGDPRLIVDTDVKICALGVTESTFVVVGEGKIITWNLPAGDCVLNARANIHDSVQTILLTHSPSPRWKYPASISPDFNHLVIPEEDVGGLDIYDMSTGKHVVGTTTGYVHNP